MHPAAMALNAGEPKNDPSVDDSSEIGTASGCEPLVDEALSSLVPLVDEAISSLVPLVGAAANANGSSDT